LDGNRSHWETLMGIEFVDRSLVIRVVRWLDNHERFAR
jgi:hypothetical protein